jgi:tRNA-Thr(GGU) m(6)t(6)A37 methyltransferase TsaA
VLEEVSLAMTSEHLLRPIGHVRSTLTSRAYAPRQGNEGAPDAWLELDADVSEGLAGIEVGQDLVVLTWLHEARRDVLRTHPRNDSSLPLSGVFATRSPDRPNPIGLHRVRVLEVHPGKLHVAPLEAIDGTPIVDIKPVLSVDAT